MTLTRPNRVRGANAWAYGLRLADGGVVTFSVQRDDGAAIQGIRASAYRTTTLARKMGVRDLPGYQHAALVAIREFEATEVKRRPAKAPCRSCPYRRDVPSGVWAEDEYAKLPPYDLATGEQPHGVFYCHQQDGRVCAGWAGCHDMDENLALRLAAAADILTPDDVDAILDYRSPVQLFDSGAEAAAHGLAEVTRPGETAIQMIQRLERKRG